MLLKGKVTIESKKLDNLIGSKVVRHRYKHNYDRLGQEQLDKNLNLTVGFPPGYDLIKAEQLEEFFIDGYPYNILIPEIYGSLVIFENELTEDLRVNDVLMVGSNFYCVNVEIASGTDIKSTDVTNINSEVILSGREENVIKVGNTGTYYVRENVFFPVSSTTGLTSGKIIFDYEREKIYESLPLNSYYLGELEDKNIIILNDRLEIEQLIKRLSPGQKIFVLTDNTYYEIVDPREGVYTVSESETRLLSPTRFLMKGADSGLEYLDRATEETFANLIDPKTANVEDLDYSAQIFGLDGIANGLILNEDFLGQEKDRNPLSEREIRILIANSLGWAKPDSPEFNGLNVKLFDENKVGKIDFTFVPGNNFLSVGDRGIILDGEEWEAITPTDTNTLTLRNVKTYLEMTVTSGTRIQGVVYNSVAFPNEKGDAMADFLTDIPKRSGEPLYRFNLKPSEYDTVGHQTVTLESWIDNQSDIELMPGYSYLLDYQGYDLTPPTLSEVTPIESYTIDSTTKKILFKVKPDLDNDVTETAYWDIFGGLKFTVGKVERTLTPQTFYPEDWQGIIGSRGSQYGITVANTIIGLETKVPYITGDKSTVTLVKDEKEFEKASLIEKYIGSKQFFTRTQYKQITSNLSYSNDYWIAEHTNPRSLVFTPTSQFLYYKPTGQLLELKANNELYIDNISTQRFLPVNSVIGEIQGKLAYFDPLTKEIHRTRYYNLLSTFDLYDQGVEAFNSSHGYYLKKNTDVTFPTFVYRDRRQVKKVNTAISDCQLLKEYPYLVQSLPNGEYYYTDLLKNKALGILDQLCDRCTNDGKVLYDDNYMYSITGVDTVTSGTAIVDISPDYRYSAYYNFQDSDFQYYQVLLEDGSVKFLDKERIIAGNATVLFADSIKEGEDYRVYF